MNTREDINMREDPSPLNGPQRMAYESRIGKKSERDTEDAIISSRGGNNGLEIADERGMLSGYHQEMYDYGPVAEYEHAQHYVPEHACTVHRGHPQQHYVSHARHHHGHGMGSVDHCPHRPKCRYFMTFGYWCRLTPHEKNVIKSIRS
jgi:hypothetical protein